MPIILLFIFFWADPRRLAYLHLDATEAQRRTAGEGHGQRLLCGQHLDDIYDFSLCLCGCIREIMLGEQQAVVVWHRSNNNLLHCLKTCNNMSTLAAYNGKEKSPRSRRT